MKTITAQAKIIVLALALALGISYVSAAGTWTGPTATPPGGNVDTPVNVGNNAQSKAGDLSVGAFLANLNSLFLGNVTIGTTAAPATLTIKDGSQGAGKVLTSDANGVASWGAGGGGTTPGICNSANTGPADSSIIKATLSLIKDGENMCTDGDGCMIRGFSTSAGSPVSTFTPVYFYQLPNNEWYTSAPTTGTNGDAIHNVIVNTPIKIIDDSSTATSSDTIVVDDLSSSQQYSVIICD
jgi:hypothetical protein